MVPLIASWHPRLSPGARTSPLARCRRNAAPAGCCRSGLPGIDQARWVATATLSCPACRTATRQRTPTSTSEVAATDGVDPPKRRLRSPPAVIPGMAIPGMTAGGDLSLRLGGSTPSVAATSLVLVGVLCLVAVRHAGQLRVAVATQRAWSIPGRPDLQQPAGAAFLRQRASGLVLAPGLSLGCQLAMSGTMIYMLVLMA